MKNIKKEVTALNHIKALREKNSFSIEKIAEYLNISTEDVKKLEDDETVLTVEIANKLAALFGVSIPMLTSEENISPLVSFKGAENLSADGLDTIAQINRALMRSKILTKPTNKEN